MQPEIRISHGNYGTWTAAACGFGAALIVALPEIFCGNDFGAFLLGGLLLLAATLVVLVTLSVVLFRREWRFATALLFFYLASLFLFWKAAHPIHDEARWMLQGSKYRQEVLRQPAERGELQHVEWDAWGGFGAGDTEAYLVFDPQDTLEAPSRSHASGKFSGIPCEVPAVHRFESHWYAVTLYTDTDWKYCPK